MSKDFLTPVEVLTQYEALTGDALEKVNGLLKPSPSQVQDVDELVELISEARDVEECQTLKEARSFVRKKKSHFYSGRSYYHNHLHLVSPAGQAPAAKFMHILNSQECILGYFGRGSDVPLLASHFQDTHLLREQLAERGFPTTAMPPVVDYIQNIFRPRVGLLRDETFKDAKKLHQKFFDSTFNIKFKKIMKLFSALDRADVNISQIVGGIQSRSPLVNAGNLCNYFPIDKCAARVHQNIDDAFQFSVRRYHPLGSEDSTFNESFNEHLQRRGEARNLTASWKHEKHDLSFYLHVGEWLNISLDEIFGTVGQSLEDIEIAKTKIHKSDCEKWLGETDKAV